MRAIAGTIVSAGAAVVYTILSLMFLFIDPLVLLEAASTLLEGIAMFILTIAFLPFIIFLKILAIVVLVLVITGAILVAARVIKAGGILVIVGSAVGGLLAWYWFFIPVAVGLTGGILAVNDK